MALHEGSHFDAFTKLCHALDHAVSEHVGSWVPGPKEWVNVQTYYPLLVLQGELLEVRHTRRRTIVRPTNHVQFRHSSVFADTQRTYQLDVITERYLGRFLRIIDAEVTKTARFMRRRVAVVSESVKRLQRKLRNLKSASRIRAVLES